MMRRGLITPGVKLPFTATITGSQTNLNLNTWATSQGWNGTDRVEITLASTALIRSTSTGTPALTIGTFPDDSKLIVEGWIAGKGGAGGRAERSPGICFQGANGGVAVKLNADFTIALSSTGYIGGGGGGGGASSRGTGDNLSAAGGGGAGGGAGGSCETFGVGTASGGSGASSRGATGGNGAKIGSGGLGGGYGGGAGGGGGYITSADGVAGGGGGMDFPGAAGNGGANNSLGSGGSGGGNGSNGSQNSSSAYGGGGGGWGGNGGRGVGVTAASPTTPVIVPGGTGGKAVDLNGNAVTWDFSPGGSLSTVYGAVS